MSGRKPQLPRRSLVGGWPIAIVGMFLVLLTYELRFTLVPFVFAAVIGFVLDPVIGYCAERIGGRRWPVALPLCLLIYVVVLGGGYWVARHSVQEIAATIPKLPNMLRQAIETVAGSGGVTLLGTHYTSQQLVGLLITGATNLISAAQIFLAIKITAGVLAAAALTLVLIPYFLVSGPRIASGTIWLVPPERRHSIEQMLPAIVPVLRHYVIGLFCIVTWMALLSWVALGPIFHIPGAPLLAIIMGFLELIPVIGPITGIVLVGLAAAGQDTFSDVFLMVYVLVLRLLTDNAFGPLVLGKAARMHPVVVIFGFVIGAMLFGIIGLLLAVPTAATIRIILEHYYAEPIAPSGSAELLEVRDQL